VDAAGRAHPLGAVAFPTEDDVASAALVTVNGRHALKAPQRIGEFSALIQSSYLLDASNVLPANKQLRSHEKQ
jgi:hypothetical protein